MSKVIVHQVKPAPLPPKTYDILGLTEDEMGLIVNLLGLTSGELSYGLWRCLPDEMFRPGYFTEQSTLCPKGK